MPPSPDSLVDSWILLHAGMRLLCGGKWNPGRRRWWKRTARWRVGRINPRGGSGGWRRGGCRGGGNWRRLLCWGRVAVTKSVRMSYHRCGDLVWRGTHPYNTNKPSYAEQVREVKIPPKSAGEAIGIIRQVVGEQGGECVGCYGG